MSGRRRFIAAIFMCLILSGCRPGGRAAGSVTVASKQFTENVILSEMYAQLIESRTDLEVVRKQSIGTTAVCYASMENGEVDIYVEYTGTIYSEILDYKQDPNANPNELFERMKKEMKDDRGVTVLDTIGLNNTFALAMTRGKAEALGIVTMSDLVSADERLIFAANDLFYTRFNDGYEAMVERYGFQFMSNVKMLSPMLYDAAADGHVDVIVVYATDSLFTKYDMVILDDDKQMFPGYYALPIIRSDTLKKYPELDGVLNLLAGSIDNETMQELNYLVDVGGGAPADAAREFLTDMGLLGN